MRVHILASGMKIADIPKCETCLNKSCFINRYCSSKWYSEMDTNKSCLLYKKGEKIIQEGNAVMGIYFIYSGKVKVYKEGIVDMFREQIIRLAKPGDIVGHRGYGEHLIYSISVVALEGANLCFIENQFFFNILRSNPDLMFHLLMFYAEELKRIEKRLRNMAQMSVREKVADALLFIAEAYGTTDNSIINAGLTRQEIASIAGTVPEQVIRQLTNFANEGLITKIEKKIKILDLEKIREIIRPSNVYDP
ncbi:MAG: Crp/Fnr family transcriptional regulator [Cytophagales bacterium]|nr:Crp/Fnr family transcriptional regulator [Cytophagales bacterium]